MDLNRLRRLATEVDEEHRHAIGTMVDDLAADLAVATPAGAARRSFLRGGFVATAGAVALAVGPMAGRAAAADATTTTTAPPKFTSPDDAALLAFAQSIELAVASVYDAALASNRLSSASAEIATLFKAHHVDHAAAHAALAGKAATGAVNKALVTKLGSRMGTSNGEAEWLKLAFDLENAAAASYTALLGSISGTDPAAAVASIQPIEARHAVVLGQALQLPLADVALEFEPTTGALSPADYPVEG